LNVVARAGNADAKHAFGEMYLETAKFAD